MKMIYRKFGETKMRVSLLGYGGFALGEEGWTGVDSREACLTLEEAYEKGVNFFDTAPVYGKGKSETRLGEVLSAVRNKIYIATKCGMVYQGKKHAKKDLSRDVILNDIEGSLKRLKTDYIDLYQIHWPDHKTPLKEVCSVLNSLKKSKVIKNIGLCNFDFNLIQKVRRFTKISSLQNQFNFIQREALEKLIPFCEETETAFIPYSPLAQGILAKNSLFSNGVPRGDVREHNPLFNDSPKSYSAREKIMEEGKELLNKSLFFLFDYKIIPTVIISMTKRDHLRENLKILGQWNEAVFFQ